MDRLSIIIPAYVDTEAVDKKFRALLEELLRQKNDYPQTEIIVVDDGTDGLFREKHLSECYAGKDIHIAYHAERKGVSYTRNHGLAIATGNLIAFCDADDGVEPDYLRTTYEAFREHPNARAAVFGSSVPYSQNLAYRLPSLAVWSYAFTREAIGDERFDEEKQAGEDYDWLSRVWKGGGLIPVPKRIYRYDWDINPNSLSKRYNRGEFQQ